MCGKFDSINWTCYYNPKKNIPWNVPPKQTEYISFIPRFVSYCWWFRNPKQPPGMVLKPCKWWDMIHISWCRISSINRISWPFDIATGLFTQPSCVRPANQLLPCIQVLSSEAFCLLELRKWRGDILGKWTYHGVVCFKNLVSILSEDVWVVFGYMIVICFLYTLIYMISSQLFVPAFPKVFYGTPKLDTPRMQSWQMKVY